MSASLSAPSAPSYEEPDACSATTTVRARPQLPHPPQHALPLQRRQWLLASAALPLLAACTTPLRAPSTDTAATANAPKLWTGRLSLRVDSTPAQSFAALFELRGSPEQGTLSLSTPIGNILGVLQWSAEGATLNDGQKTYRDRTVEQLLVRLTGTPLPVHALFDWLAGRPSPVPGWQLQLNQIQSGRLQAVRNTPMPTAELRVAFEPAPVLPAPSLPAPSSAAQP